MIEKNANGEAATGKKPGVAVLKGVCVAVGLAALVAGCSGSGGSSSTSNTPPAYGNDNGVGAGQGSGSGDIGPNAGSGRQERTTPGTVP